MRYRVDRSVRRSGPDGRALLGGAPLRLFRLTAAGANFFDRVVTARSLSPAPAEQALIDRWVGAGVLHPEPDPGSGPITARDVTVVVPVRDRPEGLARLLGSIAAARDRPAAVIVVDDGSTDPQAVAEICEQADPADLAVELLRRETSGGPATARDEGAARAHSPVIVFLDSDCVVDPDWSGALLAHLADPSVAAVAPRVRAAPAGGVGTAGASGASGGVGTAGAAEEQLRASALLRYDMARSPLDMGVEPGRVAPGSRIAYVPGAALAIRTTAFERLAGFDETLRVGEDVDLIWRAVENGLGIRYEPRSVVQHEVRAGLRSWVRQRFDYGTSAAALEERHPGTVAPVVVSGWSLKVWGLIAAGHPFGGAATAVATTARLRRVLPDVSTRDVLRLGLGGHLGAGGQLSRAVVRVWWPIAVPLALVSSRARRILVVSVGWTVVEAWRSRAERAPDAALDPFRFAALTLLDDVSYGAGAWAGCRHRGSWRAVLPRISSGTT